MSGQSAFEKRYVDPKEQSDVEGLLEHFNLPPKVISFLRENKRAVQVGVAVIIIVVVAVSLYGSYKEKRIETAASSLALALKETGGDQAAALERVATEYSNTASGVWAEVELAHLAMKEKNFELGAKRYSAVVEKAETTNPLYPLALTGLAQALEGKGDLDGAYAEYGKLKAIEGYMLTGYNGMARILESRGEIEQALGIYGQYLAVLGDAGENSGERAVVDAKIARLKAKQ